MTTSVHIWSPRGQQVGHAAVEISGAAGYAYISWWPNAGDKESTHLFKDGSTKSVLLGVPGVRFTFERDKDGEGGFMPITVKLQGLLEGKMIDWWKRFSVKNWSLLNNNCAQISADALRVGGASEVVEGLEGWRTSWQATYWKPMEVLTFARAIEKGLRTRKPK